MRQPLRHILGVNCMLYNSRVFCRSVFARGKDHLFRRSLARVVLTGVACFAALTFASVASDAKTPGKTYCFNGICHYVRTIAETRQLVGKTVILKASFYDDCKNDRFNPCGLTSSGEHFRSWKADNAASPIYPDGTKLLVWHPKTKKTLVVRINNAGPYWGDRKLDLSRAAAEKLGTSGITNVHVRVLEAPTQKEATYSRGRTYTPVQGFVGIFADIDRAFSDIGRSIAGLFTPATAEAKPAVKTAAVKVPAVKTAAKPAAVWAPKSALAAASVTPAKAIAPAVPAAVKANAVVAAKRKSEAKSEPVYR